MRVMDVRCGGEGGRGAVLRRAGALLCLGMTLVYARVCFATPSTASLLTQGSIAIERYSTTGERANLQTAVSAARTLSEEVTDTSLTRSSDDELISYARLCAVVSSYSGEAGLAKSAERMAQHLAARRETLPDESKKALSLVERELHSEPVRITVVGAKSDQGSQALWREAVRATFPHMRREWWDRGEGALPHADVRYPILSEPAAFVCSNKKCSLPLYTPQELRERLEELEVRYANSEF